MTTMMNSSRLALHRFWRPTLLSSTTSTLSRGLSTLKDSYDNVLVETRGKVGLVTLNRPKALNALSDELFEDLLHATSSLDADENIGCMVLTGSPKGACASER